MRDPILTVLALYVAASVGASLTAAADDDIWNHDRPQVWLVFWLWPLNGVYIVMRQLLTQRGKEQREYQRACRKAAES